MKKPKEVSGPVSEPLSFSKNRRCFSSMVLATVVLLWSSCQDERMEQPGVDRTQEVKIHEGRLQFDNQELLDAFVVEQKKASFEDFKRTIAVREVNGFSSLLPVFDFSDKEKLEAYKTFKLEQKTAWQEKMLKRFPTSRAEIMADDDISIDEDALIADDYFASLLNKDREIEVAGTVYKYTEDGIYSAPVDKSATLKKISNADFPLGKDKGELDFGDGVRLSTNGRAPLTGCACNTPSGGAPAQPTPTYPTKDQVKQNLKMCKYTSGSSWEIFGPNQTCTDYFESDKRVKVKAWSQNYGIFSSVGTNVRSQNRFLRIWWAEDISELEIGYTAAYFEYKIPKYEWPGKSNFVWEINYNGSRYDQMGTYLGPATGGPQGLFENFPFSDPDANLVTVFLPLPFEKFLGITVPNVLDVTAGDFNKKVKSWMKKGFTNLTKELQQAINGPAIVVYPSDDNKRLKFVYVDWTSNKKNDNKISKTFDWNSAIVGTKVSPAASYYNYKILMYGMGRRGQVWKGARIDFDPQ